MTDPAKFELQNIANLSEEERIRPDLPQMQAIARPRYTMEWGVRERDNALVIHIFPHIDGDNVSETWDESYVMDKRLDYAIPTMFEVSNVHAGFENEFNSFFIIVQGVIAPDLRLLVQRFLEQIEGAPVAH